ncbi:MAG: hypothetical protein B6D64_08010 [Bacteroidetes bacterium 4484_276]|nr:MAG: hypothetical protein B6D64_08010 [Bacteroidetes bacterium 4484_276]
MKKLVVFQIDNQRFALPLPVVERVVQVVEIFPLPKMSDYVHGIINLHGKIIPVINMRFLFGLPAKEIELSNQLIIAITPSGKLALLVDSTHEVFEFDDDKIVKSDNIMYGMRYVQGVIKTDDGVVLINDVGKFLDPEELKRLENALKESSKKPDPESYQDQNVKSQEQPNKPETKM